MWSTICQIKAAERLWVGENRVYSGSFGGLRVWIYLAQNAGQVAEYFSKLIEGFRSSTNDKCQTHPDIEQTVYMDAWNKCHKTACTSLPENEHLVDRNMPKTIKLN
jgi:hypothetical protein